MQIRFLWSLSLKSASFALAGVLLSISQGPLAKAARLIVSCGSVGSELELCRSGAESWATRTGNQVEVLAAPVDSNERLAQYQLLLAAKSQDIDIFLIDTTWPGLLGNFLVDLKSFKSAVSHAQQNFQSFIDNNTFQGRLVAMPSFIDAGLLYYRKDLLTKYQEPPPETWEELTRISQKIQSAERAAGHSQFWGYVFEGRAYEGLTCNALEWIQSYGGGSFIHPQGQITIDNPEARKAVALATSWMHTLSPAGVLNYMEEDARGVFQSGNALFMRNWPYVWKLANAPNSPIHDKVGISPLPRGVGPNTRHASILGGWSLAVSKFSRSKEEAVSLVLYLTGLQEQKRRALLTGLNPTLPALYQDPDLLKGNPILTTLFSIFNQTFPRPSQKLGPQYNQVSAEFWNTIHGILSGEEDLNTGFLALTQKFRNFSRGRKWG